MRAGVKRIAAHRQSRSAICSEMLQHPQAMGPPLVTASRCTSCVGTRHRPERLACSYGRSWQVNHRRSPGRAPCSASAHLGRCAASDEISHERIVAKSITRALCCTRGRSDRPVSATNANHACDQRRGTAPWYWSNGTGLRWRARRMRWFSEAGTETPTKPPPIDTAEAKPPREQPASCSGKPTKVAMSPSRSSPSEVGHPPS